MTKYLQVRKQPRREAKGHMFQSTRIVSHTTAGKNTFASQVAQGMKGVEHIARLYKVQPPEQVSA
jgi:hypothetical protein